jgi:hypothetical protein
MCENDSERGKERAVKSEWRKELPVYKAALSPVKSW